MLLPTTTMPSLPWALNASVPSDNDELRCVEDLHSSVRHRTGGPVDLEAHFRCHITVPACGLATYIR